jgi:hypothetical protein
MGYYRHHQPINVLTTGAQAFLVDSTSNTRKYGPLGCSSTEAERSDAETSFTAIH